MPNSDDWLMQKERLHDDGVISVGAASILLADASPTHVDALTSFSVSDLLAIERSARSARKNKCKSGLASALDLEPLDLGELLLPLSNRDELYDEMLGAR